MLLLTAADSLNANTFLFMRQHFSLFMLKERNKPERTTEEGAQHPNGTLSLVPDYSLPCRATKWQVFSLFVFEDGSCFLCT